MTKRISRKVLQLGRRSSGAPERNPKTSRMERRIGPRMQLVDHTDKAKIMTKRTSKQMLPEEISPSHFTVLVDQQASSKELILNTIWWMLCTDEQTSWSKQAVWIQRLGLWRYLWRISAQVVYWMKNECIVSIEEQMLIQQRWTTVQNRKKATQLEVLSIDWVLSAEVDYSDESAEMKDFRERKNVCATRNGQKWSRY